MKKNVLITLGGAACLLVSCNTRLPKITDEQGIEIAMNMVTRHSDSSLFQLPNKFVITSNFDNSTETNDSAGHIKSWLKRNNTYSFDLDNLYYKEHQKASDQNGENEYTYYYFYDNATGTFYSAYNKNDYKTRTEEKINAEAAKSKITRFRTSLIEFITYESFLSKFESTIENAKKLHEKYIAEKDQYYNYFVGSADAKSLQYSVEQKLKQTQGGDPEYSGYSQSTSSVIFQNDLFTSFSSNSNMELKSKDGKFYRKSLGNSASTTSYGGCPIEKPNIGEYILK